MHKTIRSTRKFLAGRPWLLQLCLKVQTDQNCTEAVYQHGFPSARRINCTKFPASNIQGRMKTQQYENASFTFPSVRPAMKAACLLARSPYVSNECNHTSNPPALWHRTHSTTSHTLFDNVLALNCFRYPSAHGFSSSQDVTELLTLTEPG